MFFLADIVELLRIVAVVILAVSFLLAVFVATRKRWWWLTRAVLLLPFVGGYMSLGVRAYKIESWYLAAIAIFMALLPLSILIVTHKKWRWQECAILVLLLTGGVGFPAYQTHQTLTIRSSEKAQKQQERKEHFAKAEAMFQERCKKSGEFIYRTAEDVEGVFLLKLRPRETNMRGQYKMDDPYGSDFGGDAYIGTFLKARNEKGWFNPEKPGGYRYVDAVNQEDGKRYRYTSGMKVVGRKDTTAHNVKLAMSKDPNYDLNIYSFGLDKVHAPDPAPRYGVTYDDISTREERDYWIAGSSLKVIDLETNEVMAERIGYMVNHRQGNDSGGRSPWLFAADYACPRFGPEKVGVGRSFYQAYQTRTFVEKVLHLTKEK